MSKQTDTTGLFPAEHWRARYSGRISGPGLDGRIDFYISALSGSFRIS